MRSLPPALLVAGLLLLLPACGDDADPLPQGSAVVELDADDFSAEIDNAYWPMRPGSRWVYRETDAEGTVQRIVVTVTDRTTRILGIDARVVHDVATEDGEVVENTWDWYAQDEDGNVWYLGEDTTAFEEGKAPSKEGSWRAGVRGAQPGVIVPAEPEVGLRYRQEYLRGEAEDAGEVLSVDATARVPAGFYEGALRTRDTTPLEPDLVEEKTYAKGVGPVLDETVAGGSDRAVLIEFSPG
jgi:hypothetical protein